MSEVLLPEPTHDTKNFFVMTDMGRNPSQQMLHIIKVHINTHQ